MRPHLSATHLVVNARVHLPLGELQVETSTPGGPGGQHANRTESKVTVKVDLVTVTGLGPHQRARVIAKLGETASATSAEHRGQARNREQAFERLGEKLAGALVVEPQRRPTKPSKAAKARRVDAKQRRGTVKQTRRRPSVED